MSFWRSVVLAATAALLVSSPADGRRLPVRIFTIADGLPQNQINCVLEDSRGFLWIGTSDGLARFDGRDFVTYGVAEGLPHPVVTDILEVPDGSLWLATGAGVARFATRESSSSAAAVRTYRLGADVGSNSVWRIHRDRRGRIWAGSSYGLFVLEPGRDSFRAFPLDLPKPAVPFVMASSLSEDAEGGLWVGTSWALVRLLPDGRQIRYRVEGSRSPASVKSVLADPKGRIWVSWIESVITVFRPSPVPPGQTEAVLPSPRERCLATPDFFPRAGETCEISPADGIPDRESSILLSPSGRIWLLDGAAACSIEPGGLRCEETAARFGQFLLTCLTEDRYDSLWIGTESGGLARIARTGFSMYGTEEGLLVDRVSSVFEGSDGELYVTAANGAIHRFEGERFVGVTPRLPPRLTQRSWGWNQVALLDHAGEWWYCTNQGLVRYSAVGKLEDLARVLPRRVYTDKDGLPSNSLFRVFEDSRGDIWASMIEAAPGAEKLVRWERATERLHVYPPIFPGNAATAFARDRSGNTWIGFYLGGLARYREGRFDLFPPGGGVPSGFVGHILLDSMGRLWIATSAGGVARVEDPGAERPSFRVYGRTQGLSSDRAYALAEDRSGHLYVATSRGIDRLDPATGRVRRYTAAGGVAPPITSSAFRDRHGRLWFGTLHGLLRFEPTADAKTAPPRVFLRGLEAGGRRFLLPAAGLRSFTLPDLPREHDHIRIEVLSPYLAPAEQIRFRHRLEGSTDWSDPSSDGSVEYAGLPPGHYRFLVEAVTSEGTRSREPASLDFRVLPPLWQRWWFLAAAGLALAALLLWLHRLRVMRLLEVEQVRARIAADLHDDLGTSLYRISILSELADRRVGVTPSDARPLLSEIGETARDLIESAGDMVWSVDPRRDSLADLVARVRHYASEILEAQGVAGSLEGPDGAERISLAAETRRQLYLIFKEAIRNALRHGRPRNVAMRLAVNDGRLEVEIRDDGAGIPRDHFLEDADEAAGYGLGTMRRRAESLGGVFLVSSEPGGGTRILVDVPLIRSA